jgi:DNA-binding NarL/FixJ family response regulator
VTRSLRGDGAEDVHPGGAPRRPDRRDHPEDGGGHHVQGELAEGDAQHVDAIVGQHPLQRLADRELAVAKLIAQGKTNHEISRELFISVATVKAYVSRLLSKLELNNRVQVAPLVHDAALD